MLSSRYNLAGPDARQIAAALRTVGFKTACSTEKDNKSAGRAVTTWFVGSSPADAIDLVRGIAKTPCKMHALERFRVSLSAIKIREKLDAWIRSGADWYEMTGAPKPEMEGVAFVNMPPHLIDFAAAAMAVGNFPFPRPVGGRIALAIKSGISELRQLGDAYKQATDRRGKTGIAKPITLPGHAPEEHPFLYAVEAIIHNLHCTNEERRSKGNPTGMFRGVRQRTAFVSESLLKGDGNEYELMEKHLAGKL